MFHKKQSTPQKFKQSPKFIILTLNKEKYLKLCHTERSEVSIQKTENRLLNTKFGVDISPYKLCVTKRSVETKFMRILLCMHLASCYVVFFTKGSIRQNLSSRELSKAKFAARHKQRWHLRLPRKSRSRSFSLAMAI